MDVIFDLDGTLADPSHRLHFINDPAYFKPGGITRDLKPDWDSFLSDEQMAKDEPIVQTWNVLESLVEQCHRVIFITGRYERSRAMTEAWLNPPHCFLRTEAMITLMRRQYLKRLPIYMRADGDRRSSSVVKQEGLMRARADGYDPVLAFEDRKDDVKMWRRNGLLCCQVAEGHF